MSYKLIYSTGELIIPENDYLPRITGIEIDIPGKNFSNYGKFYNQNLIDILENFARYSSEPTKALKGQIWFDKSVNGNTTDTDKGLLKYNIGGPGETIWKEIAANGNDVYFNNMHINSMVIDANLTVGGDITILGDIKTTSQHTSDPFYLLNENINKINAFQSSREIILGGKQTFEIVSVRRDENNVAYVSIDENYSLGENQTISIYCSDPSFNAVLTTASNYDSSTFSYVNIGPQVEETDDVQGTVYYGKTYIDNDLSLYGNLKLLNGSIFETDSVNFSFLPKNTTNLEIGKVATTINIGSNSGVSNINNNLFIHGDLDIKGGDLTTDQTEFNLLNSAATTINAFGDASIINIGSTVGDTNINNNLNIASDTNIGGDLYVTGDVNIEGRDLITHQPVFSLLNTTVTTINAFGNANLINIGVSGNNSSLNIKNDNVDIDGDLNIDGGDLTSNVGSFNLLNTSVGLINAFGDAIDVNIGNAEGLTNIKSKLGVAGDFYIKGQNTIIDSDTIKIKDSIIEIGNDYQLGTNYALTSSSLTDLTFDNKNRGILLHYYNNEPKTGFFGFDVSEKYYIFAKEYTQDEVQVYGDVRVNDTYINDRALIGYTPGAQIPVSVIIGKTDDISYINFNSSQDYNNTASYSASISKSKNDVSSSFDIVNNDLSDINIIQKLSGDIKFKTDSGKDRLYIDGETGKIGINADNADIALPLHLNTSKTFDGVKNYGIGIRFTHSETVYGNDGTGVLADIYAVGSTNDSPIVGGNLVLATREGVSQTTTPKVIIYHDGRVAIGDVNDIGSNLNIQKVYNIGSTNVAGITLTSKISSGKNFDSVYGFKSSLSMDEVINVNKLYHYAVNGLNNNGINTQYGFYVDNNLVSASNNYAFYTNLTKSDNNWGFYSSGDVRNYFGGSSIFNSQTIDPSVWIKQDAENTDAGPALKISDPTTDTTTLVVDANGSIIIGHDSVDSYTSGKVRIHDRELSISSWTGSASSYLTFYKSHGTDSPVKPGENLQTVHHNEALGIISAYGVNNPATIEDKTFSKSATISFVVDGDISNSIVNGEEVSPDISSVPGKIVFSTTSLTEESTSNTKEKVSISSNGSIRLGEHLYIGTQHDNKNVYDIKDMKYYGEDSGSVYGYYLYGKLKGSNINSSYGFFSSFTDELIANEFGYKINSLIHFNAESGPAAQQQISFYASEVSANGFTNYSFKTDIPASENNFAFYASYAKSYFGKQVSVGDANNPAFINNAVLNVNGGVNAKRGAPDSADYYSNSTTVFNSGSGFTFGELGNTGLFSTIRPQDNDRVSVYNNGVENVAITTSGDLIIVNQNNSLKTNNISTLDESSTGNINGNWVLTSGSTLQATYADLAERFESDAIYMPGTVVEIGGEKEITLCKDELSENIFGVVSDTAAYVMNAVAGDNDTHPIIALAGRVFVNAIGIINKGDRLVSAGNGLIRKGEKHELTPFNVIGRALENKNVPAEGKVLAIIIANK